MTARRAAGEGAGGFKPYPEYRDSGVEWLGAVPSHWTTRRLKRLAEVRLSGVDKHSRTGEHPVRLCNYTDVYNNDAITHDIEFMEATATEDEIRRLSLREGDVLVTKDSESWDDIAVPAQVEADLDGVLCAYHLALVRPRRSVVEGRYLRHAFRAGAVARQFMVEATGITRFALGADALGQGVLPLPSLDEQRAIAAFLDRETARIDELVAKKERLIELLEEKRTALVTHAVTKGLDPTVPMKDSGVEWIETIPQAWDARRSRSRRPGFDPRRVGGTAVPPSPPARAFHRGGSCHVISTPEIPGRFRRPRVRQVLPRLAVRPLPRRRAIAFRPPPVGPAAGLNAVPRPVVSPGDVEGGSP